MFSVEISFVFCFITGFVASIQAEITIRVTSRQPESQYVFTGNQIKLQCESSDSQGRAVRLTWHLKNHNTPAITNSSNTSITTWNKGNKTISLYIFNVSERRQGLFFVYCSANNGIKSDVKYTSEPFEFVPASSIPKISVSVPQTQTVSNGTRQHRLHCKVSSNVNIDKLKIEWKFDGKTFTDKLIEKTNQGELNFRLQCLTEKDLGQYSCVASTTMFGREWKDSAVTNLTGKFNDVTGIGIKNLPSSSLSYIIILLSIWRTFCAAGL